MKTHKSRKSLLTMTKLNGSGLLIGHKKMKIRLLFSYKDYEIEY
ncbi:hypothetical protein PLUTE_b1245 [Pseudoalteromonas luteoviolacea DSM 6061]|nr:hypothetical protein [Pseudoalteromonas luteoviolacea DSM 6061]